MAIPFWRQTPSDSTDAQAAAAGAAAAAAVGGVAAPGSVTVLSSFSSGAAAWENFLVNGRRLPGVVRLIKAPPRELKEIASEGKDKDTQMRTVRGLKASIFTVRCLLLTPQDWDDWGDIQPLLLPVTNPDGRAEVRIVAHPMVQRADITHAFVSSIDPVQVPDAGGPAAYDIHWRPWWPNTQVGAHSKVDRKPKDPVQTQTPTIGTAKEVPHIGELKDLQRPRPNRTQ